MERGAFVAEGGMELGPKEEFFIFLNGDYLGRQLTGYRDTPRIDTIPTTPPRGVSLR
ncbi:MAG: hypothetical protein M3N33_03905 [Actinomycetota bacterium]|nr:hypothetical protein [Actinomycetota bacterium]